MNCLEIPLDIIGVKVEGIEFTEAGEIFITMTSVIEGTGFAMFVAKKPLIFMVRIVKLLYAIYLF